MEKKPDIKIFVSHRIDLDSETIDNPLYVNVRCGAVYDKRDNVEMLGDDTGDNISEKRNSYCELTVQYWAWKNVEADYYGLCHYRRYFNFSHKDYTEDIYSNVVDTFINKTNIEKYGLINDINVKKMISKYDIIATNPYIVSKVGIKNIKEQYTGESYLEQNDLDVVFEIIAEQYPEYVDSYKKTLASDIFYPCCMFIMKKDIFLEYSEWLFNILGEFEKRVNLEEANSERLRCIGHIGERLLTVFINQMKSRKKIHTVQRVIFFNTERSDRIDFISDKHIPVVIVSSEFYKPYVYTLLQSINDNKKTGTKIDAVILHSSWSGNSIREFKKYINCLKDISIRFYDVRSLGKEFNFSLSPYAPHVSEESFYRLLIPMIFSCYDKVIFLDSDMIVKGDIAELYKLASDEHIITATRDADFSSQYYQFEDVHDYVDNILGLENCTDYFQAGMFIFNLKKYRSYYRNDELLECGFKRQYKYLDQDVLNVFFKKDVYHVTIEWNVMVNNYNRIERARKYAPAYVYNEYVDAYQHPQIIHYAGGIKPWQNIDVDFAIDFWEVARRTPYYEEILSRMMNNGGSNLDTYNFGLNNDWIFQHMAGDIYSRFIFPWKAVKPGAKIVMYGGGIVGKTFLRQLANHPYCHVVTVVDQNPAITGIVECPVIDINGLAEINPKDYDMVLIAMEKKDIAIAIRADLELMGIPPHKIKWVDPARK